MILPSASTIAAVLIAVAALAFGGGFTVSEWKYSGEIARLQEAKKRLREANTRYSIALQAAQASVDEVKRKAELRATKAEEAMKSAEGKAKQHLAAAKAIRTAAIPLGETECQSVGREQVEYVESRRGE